MCLAFDYKLAFCLFYALFVVPWEYNFSVLRFLLCFCAIRILCGHLGNTISWTYAEVGILHSTVDESFILFY